MAIPRAVYTDSDSGLSELANSRPGSSPDEGIGTELLDQKGIRFMLIMLFSFRAAHNNGFFIRGTTTTQ